MQTEDKKKQEMVGYIEKWHNNGILKVALAPSTPLLVHRLSGLA